MDTYMHKTMVSVASLGKIEIIRSWEFMLSEVRLKFLKKMIFLGPKTAILGPQFCRIVTSTVFESKDDPTQMTKAVIYNYILYYIQKTIHSKHICKNVHS